MSDSTQNLDALISKCDLLKVRDVLLETHRQANEEAASKGQAANFKVEYVNAWYAFRDNPSIETARAFLTSMPELRPIFERYSVEGPLEAEQIERPLHRLESALVLTASQLKQELDEIFGCGGQQRPQSHRS